MDRTIIIEDMDHWTEFCRENHDDIIDLYGDTIAALNHACQGGLVLGGGASPETLIIFAD